MAPTDERSRNLWLQAAQPLAGVEPRATSILIYNGDELYKAEFVKYMVGYCCSSLTAVSDYM